MKENGRGVDGIGLTAANRHAVGFLDHSKCVADGQVDCMSVAVFCN